MSIGENIRHKRQELGYTLQDVAKRMKTSRQTVQRYETGVIANIPSDKIEQLAEIFGVTPSYLMGWDDTATTKIVNDGSIMPINKKILPLFSGVTRGKITFAEQNFESIVATNDDLAADFALRVTGECMSGAFVRDGDVVFIRRQGMVEQGEVAAVLVNNEVILKRYFRYGDTIVFRSENSNGSDIVTKIGDTQNIKIIGKAVSFLGAIR